MVVVYGGDSETPLTLDAAHDALGHGDLAGALSLVLAQWRRRPTAEVGDLAWSLGQRMVEERPWPETGDAWFLRANDAARAGDEAALSYVLDGLLRHRTWSKALVLALAETGPDPRLARAWAALTAAPTDPSTEFWNAAEVLLRGPIDEGCAERLAAIAQGACPAPLPRTSQVVRTRCAETALLRVVHHRLRPDETDLVEALAQNDAPDRVDLVALAAAAQRRPADLPALSVWADALVAVGDPRGTFVHLQLQHARSPLRGERRAHLDALLERHRVEWLAPFGAVHAKRCAFRQGLPFRLAVGAERLQGPVHLIEEVVLTSTSEEPLMTPGLRPSSVEGVRSLASLRAALRLGVHTLKCVGLHYELWQQEDLSVTSETLEVLETPDVELARAVVAGVPGLRRLVLRKRSASLEIADRLLEVQSWKVPSIEVVEQGFRWVRSADDTWVVPAAKLDVEAVAARLRTLAPARVKGRGASAGALRAALGEAWA